MERLEIGDAGALEELRARRLTLVDAQGRVRATFGPAGDGSMELRLFDRDDRARAELAVDANGAASLTLRDPDGEMRSCLAVGHDGDTRLHLHGTAAVSLHDREGQPRALLGLDEHSGMATLSYVDAAGACCVLLTEDGSGGRLHLFQRDGRGRRIPGSDPGDPEASAALTAAPKPEAAVPPAPAERASRRRGAATALTLLLSALLGVLGGRLGTAPSSAETSSATRQGGSTVHAQEIILSDTTGTPRMRLGALPDGTPLLWMSDATRQSTLEIGVSPDVGAVVRLNGGKSSIALVAPPGEPPSLSASVGGEVLFQAPSNVVRYLPSNLWP
jgi:hypothetical protein